MLFEFLITIFLLLIAFWLLGKYINGNKDYWEKRGVHRLEIDWSLWKKLSNVTDFLAIVSAYYEKLGNAPFGGIVEFRSGALIVRDPNLIKNILIKDFAHFVDRRPLKTVPIFTKMLIGQEGEEWKRMRGILSPTFTTGKIRRLFDQVFLKCSEDFTAYIKGELEKTSGNELDLQNIFGKYTTGVIGSAVFGIEANSFREDSIFVQKVRELVTRSFWGNFKIAIFFLFPNLAKFFKIEPLDLDAVEFMRGILLKNIKLREESGEKRDDFLQLMIEAKMGSLKKEELTDDFEKDAEIKSADENTQLDNEDIICQAILFLFAGFETVGAAISFAFYNLATQQDWQEKICSEILDIVSRDGKLSYDGINKMESLDMFISESLRLHPPSFVLERKCTRDYTIPGTNGVINAGTFVQIPNFCIHRDEEYFPNPLTFDPDRFSSQNKDKIIPYTYSPFGIGPRNCVGMRFALIEIKCLVANFILNFKIEPCGRTNIPIRTQTISGTLKPVDGIFKITPRICAK